MKCSHEKKVAVEVVIEPTLESSPYNRSDLRTTIVTPKGTKRKVRPSHVSFQGKLDAILDANVVSKEGESLAVNSLLERLYLRDSLKAMGKRQLLVEVSKKLQATVKYRGKERKGYYDGFALTCKDDSSMVTTKAGQATETPTKEFASPKCKLTKGHDTSETPICKTKLSFQGSSTCEFLTPPCMDNLTEQLKEMEVSIPGVKDNGENQSEDMSTPIECQVEDLSSKNQELVHRLSEVQQQFDEYVSLSTSIMNKQDSVIELYKDIIGSGAMLGGLLSISEKNAIRDEINMAKDVFNLGLRGNGAKDLLDVLSPSLFGDMLTKLKQNCPTIISILEQLVLSANSTRNAIKTPQMKMKAAVHLLASLMDVRDQHAHNDIPILFGLLCLCFGAGPSMINLLQRLGLSESYPVLINILKLQIQHYKEIIKQRVVEDWPVVTFQDNMQLMRTSMRHLRLSKLHKEKAKQNKMWDFTVRGWRVADITGMEELFQKREFAAESQRNVKDLKSDDFLIENNPVHEDMWKDVQTRNTLRKMDIALNHVPISREQLKSMNSEELQKIASAPLPEKNMKQFQIKVPEIPCEFPDRAEKESKIYPLPISHENQCTTLGVASNLDLFKEEFGFETKKEDIYLPLRSSGKDFDIDVAYKRFAFLKMLEQHKKSQLNYEQFLRGHEQPEYGGAGTNEDEDHEVLLVVNGNQESDSDSHSD